MFLHHIIILGSYTKNKNKLLLFLGAISTFTLVTFIWVFFRAESIEKAMEVLKQCFVYNFDAKKEVVVNSTTIAMVIVFLVFEIAVYKSRFDVFLQNKKTGIRWVIYILLAFCLLLFSGIQSYQFIYFQF